MGRRHFELEQIIHMRREAEIKPAGGKTTGEVCRELGKAVQVIICTWRARANYLFYNLAPVRMCAGASNSSIPSSVRNRPRAFSAS